MNCYCGHNIEWDHYKRTPGNGQRFDWVCMGCVALMRERPHDTLIDPWHKPSEEKP